MKKLLVISLTFLICFSGLNAQQINGNYTLDSLVVNYLINSRPLLQEGNDGNMYMTKTDSMLSNYNMVIGFPAGLNPLAGETMHFTYDIPYFDPAGGELIGATTRDLSSPELLAEYDADGDGTADPIVMSVDFYVGGYKFQPPSTYPTISTENCISRAVVNPVDDLGVWTDGNHAPLVDEVNKTSKTGWGITESEIFAKFKAPDMVNDVYGTNYGPGTDMPNWGYMQVNYDDNFEMPIGLNCGWRATDGPDTDIGVVSEDDQYYVEAERALGLLNGHYGLLFAPVDSVTIPGVAQLAAQSGITINVPYLSDSTFNKPLALGGGGAVNPTTGETVIDPNTGRPLGQFLNRSGYIFDPKGDVLGGKDGVLFSGDEALRFTGYYATWNVLKTIFAVTRGVGVATQGGTAAATVPTIVDSIWKDVFYVWDLADANIAALSPGFNTFLSDTITYMVTAAVTAGAGQVTQQAALTQVLTAVPFIILGTLDKYEANLGNTTDWDETIIVDDSGWDLDPEDWDDWADDGDPPGTPNAGTYAYGGRIYAELVPNCIPAKWTQIVDSHWNYMGETVSLDNENIVVDGFKLKGNYPNPFNPITKIRFTNDRTSNVVVNVFSLKGERVATIMDSQLDAGAYDVSWNGMNSNGKIVPSGMYLYEIKSDERRLQGKMLFLK